MKKYWVKRFSIIFAALLLLVILPMSAMAERGTEPRSGILASSVKATDSNARRQVATPSNAERKEQKGGDIGNNVKSGAGGSGAGGNALRNDLKPAQPALQPVAAPALPKTEARITKKDFAGAWTADEATIYRFDENGSGRLILPEHTYGFRFDLEDEELVLRFESGRVGKVRFLFTLEEDALILERAEGGFGEVVLERVTD